MIENRDLYLPSSPGVYLLKDAAGTIIYIGKAKSLKDRVKNYLNPTSDDWRLEALKQEYVTIDYFVTKNEMAALLLEAELIKQHQPKYNVLLKAGQPFLYICITNDPLPQVVLVRNKKLKGQYFGPLIHKMQARSAFTYLMHTFKLNLCKSKIENGCLKYHIGLCAGNCKKDFDEQEYIFRVQLAIDALKSNHREFLAKIKDQLAKYTQTLEFEKAKHLHSYLDNIDAIMHALKLRFNPARYASRLLTPPKISETMQEALVQLQQLLGLERPISTIDCFDISHFQSSSIVGSCIRFTNGLPDKNNFRRFKIRSLEQQNDYAALQEIVSRRYRDAENLPDVILIDGGKGQLSAIKDLVSIPCISLAKREETLYTPTHPEGVKLDIHTPMGKMLIALRDYAHHFAITYHQKRRSMVAKN